MGKIEVIQIPKELHPAGEGLLKIMHGPEEPPKSYIWAKGEDEYYIWNGKKWIPYEFELIKNKGCIQKNCCCVTNEQMAVKFDKFKKDVLEAVLKMNQTQDATNIADIRQQLAQLNVIIHQLEEFENYYTKEEINENYYNKSSIDEKTNSLTNLTNALNNSVNGLSRRIISLETNLSDTLSTIARLDAIDHTQFVTARDVSDIYDYDTDGHIIIEGLEGIATEDYVDRAISNVIGGAPSSLNTLKELADVLETKADKSEISQGYDDTELINRIESLENNPATDPTIVTRIENLESKPFDQYLTNDEGFVISTSMNSLNDRLQNVENFEDRIKILENKPFEEYLTTEDELVIASGLNDLNDRLSKVENNCVITEDFNS